MTLKYLKFYKKWVVIYKGRILAVGDNTFGVLDEAFQVFKIIYAK